MLNNLHLPAEHFVNLEDYEIEQRPFKRLFIDKYPELVSRHSLDLGNSWQISFKIEEICEIVRNL